MSGRSQRRAVASIGRRCCQPRPRPLGGGGGSRHSNWDTANSKEGTSEGTTPFAERASQPCHFDVARSSRPVAPTPRDQQEQARVPCTGCSASLGAQPWDRPRRPSTPFQQTGLRPCGLLAQALVEQRRPLGSGVGLQAPRGAEGALSPARTAAQVAGGASAGGGLAALAWARTCSQVSVGGGAGRGARSSPAGLRRPCWEARF